jgi:DNA polymerase I-like protein with 3'-5' exonuclease and polymerase domains
MIITSDFEITTYNKGSPFDPRNKAVCLGVKLDDENTDVTFGHFGDAIDNLSGTWCFFNAKFDCHWYRRLGLWPLSGTIWCCQIGEFILEGQTNRYPSLEQAAIKYGLGHKIDVVKEDYWNKGINTDFIPPDILSAYCAMDVELTYKVYQKQLEQFQANPKLFRLFKLMCQDLLVLEEMEWNGQVYDEKLCEERATTIQKEIDDINQSLRLVYPDVDINFGSGDQLSAFLYGGPIFYEEVEHVGFYKNGKPKYKRVEKFHQLPRLVEPLKGTELKKEGVNLDGSKFHYYKTDVTTLRKLKGPAAKKFVGPLLRLSELDKLNSTYYRGIPEKNKEMNWKPGMVHGQFNQVVAQTGRLSASQPNQQNFATAILDIFVSRYND